MEANKAFYVAIVFLFIYSQIGESIPIHTKKDESKYISPMENFWLMANKYKVHDQPDSNVTDQKSSNVTSGKIAVQNLEANVTRSDDDVTTTQSNPTTIA